MKALSLHQPWATFVARGFKRLETRSWGTSHRGTVAIHAAKTRESIDQDNGRYKYDLLRDAGLLEIPGHLIDFPLGAVVAVADLFDCYEVSGRSKLKVGSIELTTTEGGKSKTSILERREEETIYDPRGEAHMIAPAERILGDLSPGRFAWRLDNVRALRAPVACRGMQGLFTLPPEVEAAVNAQLLETTHGAR